MTKDTPLLKDLPFADGQFPTIVTEYIHFNLQKDGRPVTLVPVNDPSTIPPLLVERLRQEFNFVVEEGLTYPHHKVFDSEQFIAYWFYHFVAVLLDGHFTDLSSTENEPASFWDKVFLGNFYIKPNYIGRCSHVCNGGFIVNHEKRGLGLGTELGRKYLDLAPKLGYVYSVFNLVFETNPASMKIWDNLGFDRIGYVKGVGALKGHDELVGAVMYGKTLT